jgi:uncharacterized membrane protein
VKTLNLEPHPDRGTIQNASALILRVGVITSMLVMLVGLSISFAHRPLSVEYMQRAAFDGRLSTLWRGLREGRGQSVMELGIYLLVFTPILRVAVSMVLFLIEERDRRYTVITFGVLVLTLAGLLFLR